MRVKIPRLFIDVPTIKVSELKYYMKPRKLRLLERYWERRRQNKVAGRVIVSDMPLENKEDPLWEQQLRRLGDISSDDEDNINSLLEAAERLDGETQEANGGKKKVVSYHKRLSNAFCKTNRKPRKKPTDTKKFINHLSLLHQATLANLTDTNSSYGDKVEKDHVKAYDDVMYKFALFSPPHSEKGDLSPPVALSPTEIAASKEQLRKAALNAAASQESRSGERSDLRINAQDNSWVSSPSQNFNRPSPTSLEDSSRSETGSSSPRLGPPPYTVKETIVKIGAGSPKKANLKLNTDIARIPHENLLSPSADGGLSDLPSHLGPASQSPTLNMPGQAFWPEGQRRPEQNSYMHNPQNMSSYYPSQDRGSRQMSGSYMPDRPKDAQGQPLSEPLRAMEGMMSRMPGPSQFQGSDPNHHMMGSPPPLWGPLNSPPGQPFHGPRPNQHHSLSSPGYPGQHYPPPSHPGSSPHAGGFHPVYSGPPHHGQHHGQTSPHMMWGHPMNNDRSPSRSAGPPYFGHSYPTPGQDPLSPLGITHGSPEGYFGSQHPLSHSRLPPYYNPLGMHGPFHPPPYPGPPPPPHSNTSPMARMHPDPHHNSAPTSHGSPYGPIPVSQHSAAKSPVHSQPPPSGHISPRGSRTPSHDSTPNQTPPVTQPWSNNQSSSGPSPTQSENTSPNQSHGPSPTAPNSGYSRSEQSPSTYPQDSHSQNANQQSSQQQSPPDASSNKSPYPADASPSPQFHPQQQQQQSSVMPYMPDSEGQNTKYMNQSHNYPQGPPAMQYGPSDSQNANNARYGQQQRSPGHMQYQQEMGSPPPHYPRPLQSQHYPGPSHYPTDNSSSGYPYNQPHNYPPQSMPGHSPRQYPQWMGHNDPNAQQQPSGYNDQNANYRNSNPSPTYTQLGAPQNRRSPAASPVQSWPNNSWGNSAPTPAQRTFQRSPSHSHMAQSPSPSFNQPSYQQQQPIDQQSPSTSQPTQGTEYNTPPPLKPTDPSPTLPPPHHQHTPSPHHLHTPSPPKESDAKASYSTATALAPPMSQFSGDTVKDSSSAADHPSSPDKEQFKQPAACVRRSSSCSSNSSRRELEHIHCSSPIRSPSPVTLSQASNEARDSPSARRSSPQVNDTTPPPTQSHSAVKAHSPKSQSAVENGSASPKTDTLPSLQPGQVVRSPHTASSGRSDTEDSDSRPADHEVVSICSLSPSNEDASQPANSSGPSSRQEPSQPSIIPLHYYGDQARQVKGQPMAQSPDQHSSSTPNNQRQAGAKVKPLGLHYSDISDDEVAGDAQRDAQRAADHSSSPSSSSSSQRKTGDGNDSQSPAVNQSHYDYNVSDGLNILAAAAVSEHGESQHGSGGCPAPASSDEDGGNSAGSSSGEGNGSNGQDSSSSNKKSDGGDLGSSDQPIPPSQEKPQEQPPPEQPASCSGSDEGQTKVTLQPQQPPPSRADVEDSLLENNLPHVQPHPPFCSDPADMPAR